MMESRQILKRPLLTEKATIARETANEYAFEVDRRANKLQIRDAVEDLFSVTVKNVRTVNVRGKVKRMGVHQGRRPNWKKALITLEEGKTFDLFDEL